MNKSTYIITLLLSTLSFPLSASSLEVKDDEKTDLPYDLSNIKPIPLDMKPYEKWPKNREIIYSPRLGSRQGFEDIVNTKDERKKISKLDLKISPNKPPVNIVNYIVKLHSYYGHIMSKEVAGDGTATIIKKEKGILYLLTCAHNVVKYIDLDPFNPKSTVSYFYAKSISFSYKGKKYPCNKYYVHPQYNGINEGKDIAIVASHRGFTYLAGFIFTFEYFPEIVSTSYKKYKGYIIGYPGEKKKKNDLYGMEGNLAISGHFIEYDSIDTSQGQSGSPILAKTHGVYKIIGLHTMMSIHFNSGPSISQDIIEWEKGCWFNTKKVYERHTNIFDLGPDMEKILEESYFDVNMLEIYQKTPFLCAAKKGNLDALRLLKKKGANIYVTDKNGKNALHLASQFSTNLKVVNWLIHTTHLSIESKDKYEKTPFLCAAEEKNITILKFLKEKGANVNATNCFKRNALYWAIQTFLPKFEVIKWLVNIAKVNVNAKDNSKESPFFWASTQGNISALKLMKEKGVNVNTTDQNGRNVLHIASIYNGKLEVIDWLVGVAKVNVNARDKKGMTPFLFLAVDGNLLALKLFKKKGADVNATNLNGENALHLAINNNVKYEVIEWLVNIAKVNVHARDQHGYTPFLCSTKKEGLTFLKILKEKGANVNVANVNGENALHLAINNNAKYQVIEWLVNIAKVNVNARDQYGHTPFFCATKKEELAFLKILKEKAANVSITDKYGRNALYWATILHAKFEVIEWLKNECGLKEN